jgi:cell division protease FtsH
MDAQANYLYQRNPNDAGPNGPQRQGPGGGGNGDGNGGPPGPSGMSWLVRSVIIIAIVLLGWYLFTYFFSSNSSSSSNAIEIPYSTFTQQLTAGNVKDVTFQGTDVNGDLKKSVKITDVNGNSKTGTTFHFTQLNNPDPNLVGDLNGHGVTYLAKPVADNTLLLTILTTVVPWLILIILFLFIIRRATQGQQNIFSFGKSKAKMVLEDRPARRLPMWPAWMRQRMIWWRLSNF